ncbi:MAG: hypothetical protein RSO15_15460 [Bacteroides sp.]|uniref:hypothetical protein n=1 Tax=Bacteroides sp. TaxID=29523 RepID=UPI002FC9A6BE
MIQSFRNYLAKKVSFLDDLLAALVIVQRKRRRKVFQQKKGTVIEPISVTKVTIIGLSKTKIIEQYHLMGESKTLIPDLSPYIQPTTAETTNEAAHSICISLVNEDTDEVDLSEEEIKLDTMQSTATGVSIEDIETMNQAELDSSVLSLAQQQIARDTAEVLSGTELTLRSDPKFSKRLHMLLESCEQSVGLTDAPDTTPTGTEIDDLFN